MRNHKRPTQFEKGLRKKEFIAKAEADGLIADSNEVRMKLVARITSGELTLEEAQKELKKIIRDARKNGKMSRTEAWRQG